MGDRRWAVGVDFGGTNIKLGGVTARGRLLAHATLRTEDHATPGAFVEGIAQAIERLSDTHGLQRRSLRGVGVGAPGLVDAARGRIYRLVNVRGEWRGLPLQRLLERRLRCRCVVDNDVNMVALGEWRHGAGRGSHHSVFLTLGTGVGGALVVHDRLVRGAAGTAGEIGHVVLQPDGPPCACGARGCLEALVGTNAILRRAREAIRRGNRALARLRAHHGGRLSPSVISQAAKAGDHAALAIWREVGYYLGLSVAGLINVLSPERVVIGGGIANAWRWFAPTLRSTIQAQAFAEPARVAQVRRAALGEHAGVVGGAVAVWDQAWGNVD